MKIYDEASFISDAIYCKIIPLPKEILGGEDDE